MRVSVIIATYNRAQTIKRSIESVLVQEDLSELIVVDDGSTDDTKDVVTPITDSRIRYIQLDTNQGASAARNRGIAEAKGDYVMLWDSDDILYPNALSRVMQEFKRDPLLGIVSAPARVMIGEKELVFPRVPSGEVTFTDIACKKIPSNEKIRVARADIMKQVSYKSRHIDFLVNVELIERGEWYHIDEYLGEVFNDPGKASLTAARKKKNVTGSIERAPHLADFLARHKRELLNACAPRYADYCYGAAIGFLLAGDRIRARRYAWDAWRYHPMQLKHLAVLKLSFLPWGTWLARRLYR